MVIIQFIERSMDYVERQLKLLQMAEDMVKAEPGVEIPEFRHVSASADILSRFMEGSDIYQLFTKEEINKFVKIQLSAGTWDFITGLQQYTYVPFTHSEILEIVNAFAFAIAPNKVLNKVADDLVQSPTGTTVFNNTPDNIEQLLWANPWLVPLVALSFNRDIPIFEKVLGDE